MNKEENGTLKIYRLPNLVGRIRNYWILVDEIKVSTIKNDEAIEIQLLPGRHEVAAKLDWQVSNKVEINIVSGQEIRLRIGREQVKGKKLYAMKATCLLMILVGAIVSPALIGAGVVGLMMHHTGKIRIF